MPVPPAPARDPSFGFCETNIATSFLLSLTIKSCGSEGYIQELLGHKSSKTTEIYTHVSQKSLEIIKAHLMNCKKAHKFVSNEKFLYYCIE